MIQMVEKLEACVPFEGKFAVELVKCRENEYIIQVNGIKIEPGDILTLAGSGKA